MESLSPFVYFHFYFRRTTPDSREEVLDEVVDLWWESYKPLLEKFRGERTEP